MLATFLVWVATLAVLISLVSTWCSIYQESNTAEDFLKLTEILLSWKVIAGGITLGFASRYKDKIATLLDRLP
jgi:hypothetical protein